MIGKFFDRSGNSENGTVIGDARELHQRIAAASRAGRVFCELRGDNGYRLMMGVGPKYGCVQFSATSGEPPYLVGIDPTLKHESGVEEFLSGGTLTPVSIDHCLPMELVLQIASDFLETGARSKKVQWEAI